jgi:hypothetical protein
VPCVSEISKAVRDAAAEAAELSISCAENSEVTRIDVE